MRIACVEWPEGLLPEGTAFERITAEIARAQPDILITNELPFGDWLAGQPDFDRAQAQASVELHERGLAVLGALGVPLVITSRPVWSGERLANEAVAIAGGQVMPLHRKRYFPAEAGWHEDRWFAPSDGSFDLAELHGLKIGVLLCTELMFNERARAYGRQGADLIVVPRATGQTPVWQTACQMAAIVSGAYVVSSNRVGGSFSGNGMAIAPDGGLIGMTLAESPLLVFELNPTKARAQKNEYPCYVRET